MSKALLCATAKLKVVFFLLHSLQVTFAEEDLPRDDCEYILGYYSNNMNIIVGLSSPIQVIVKDRLMVNVLHFSTYLKKCGHA